MVVFQNKTITLKANITFFFSLKNRSPTKAPTGIDKKMGAQKAMPHKPKRFFIFMIRRLPFVNILG